MATTAFSHELRILTCDNCGAPLEVMIQGGAVTCTYCHTVNHCMRRNEDDDIRRAREAQGKMSESARLQMLRQQDHQPMLRPASVERYVAGDRLDPAQQPAALDEWRETRLRVRAGAGPTEADRLFHLTRLLWPVLDQRHARALLEDAVETLPDVRHRQVLRCKLGELAVFAGEGAAAYEWIEPCNQHATDLLMDTAFRLAAATMATAAGAHDKMLMLLGRHADDVPIADEHDNDAMVLRVHALERTGNTTEATTQMTHAFTTDLRNMAAAHELIQHATGLSLCTHSYPLAAEHIWQALEADVRNNDSAPTMIVVLAWAVALFVCLGLWVTGMISVTSDGVVPLATGIVILAIGWPGTFASLILLLRAVSRRNGARRLRENGLRTFARLMAIAPRGSRTELTFDVAIHGRLLLGRTRIQLQHPPALGVYPCIADHRNASNVQLKLA